MPLHHIIKYFENHDLEEEEEEEEIAMHECQSMPATRCLVHGSAIKPTL